MTNYEFIKTRNEEEMAIIWAVAAEGPNDWPKYIENWYEWLFEETKLDEDREREWFKREVEILKKKTPKAV